MLSAPLLVGGSLDPRVLLWEERQRLVDSSRLWGASERRSSQAPSVKGTTSFRNLMSYLMASSLEAPRPSFHVLLFVGLRC